MICTDGNFKGDYPCLNLANGNLNNMIRSFIETQFLSGLVNLNFISITIELVRKQVYSRYLCVYSILDLFLINCRVKNFNISGNILYDNNYHYITS
jgi:hypothetical protein